MYVIDNDCPFHFTNKLTEKNTCNQVFAKKATVNINIKSTDYQGPAMKKQKQTNKQTKHSNQPSTNSF